MPRVTVRASESHTKLRGGVLYILSREADKCRFFFCIRPPFSTCPSPSTLTAGEAMGHGDRPPGRGASMGQRLPPRCVGLDRTRAWGLALLHGDTSHVCVCFCDAPAAPRLASLQTSWRVAGRPRASPQLGLQRGWRHCRRLQTDSGRPDG